MAVQDYKINYKSDFVLTINGDAGWAVPFCIKFWTGMPSQAYFVGFDGVKYVNCRVGDTPTQLLVMFDDHHLPIGPLKMQIAYHTTIEEFPGSVFDEVTNARDVIVTIDGTDYQVLLDFTGEDAPELEFNLPAYANEAERIQNELQRQQNEADRIAAELQREQATAAAVQGAENVNAQLSGTTLTVTNRQGVSTSVNTKGEQGEQGPQGEQGEQGPQGAQGPQGPQGVKGETGATGATGPQGPTGVSITGFTYSSETEEYTTYTIAFSDGNNQTINIPKGEKGDPGNTGPQGATGATGNGIASTVLNNDYTLTITFTDGTTYTTSSIRGEQGERGPQGLQGNSGYTGAAGELEIVNNLTDGGAAKALSAEMGKEIGQIISEVVLSNYRIINNNLEQNVVKWPKPNQAYKAVIVPRCVLGDHLNLVSIDMKISYAFLQYDNSGTKNAVVPFAGSQTTAIAIAAGSPPVTVAIPDDCGCVYLYISTNDVSTMGTHYRVYSVTSRIDEFDELLEPVFGTEEAEDIKAGIVPINYNYNTGTFVVERPYNGTFNRAMTQYPFTLEKGEWLQYKALSNDVSIIVMAIDNNNHFLDYEYIETAGGTAIIRGDGGKKVLWCKWTNNSNITNIDTLLDNISIVRGYDSRYASKAINVLKEIADKNTDVGIEGLKSQLVLGGYTYSYGSVPQYAINVNTSYVSNSPYWLTNDVVIEFDSPLRCKAYILADNGTFRTSVQWESPLTLRKGRYVILAFSYPDNRQITDVEWVSNHIRIRKKNVVSSDFVIDRNQDAVNAIVASKDKFDRTISSYNYNNPNHSLCFTIAHITDIHTDGERFENFRKFVDNIGCIDAAILTGDLCIEPTATQFQTITSVEGMKDVMMVVGNHDRAKAWAPTTVMSLADVYANMFTARGVSTNTGELYYYQDFIGPTNVQDKTLSSPIYKIRVIVLNCYDTTSTNATYAGVNLHYSQSQINWFIATLQDALTNGYAVMVAVHTTDQQKMPVSNNKKFYQGHVYMETTPDAYEQYPIVEDIINAFKHGTTITRDYTWADISETVSVDATFSSSGTFIAYMCGHYHMDLIGVSQNYSDQLYLVGNCGQCYSYLAGRSYGEEWTPLSRKLGYKSEDCFNVYSINLDDKTIRVVRVGADINDKMEKVDFESYSFD